MKMNSSTFAKTCFAGFLALTLLSQLVLAEDFNTEKVKASLGPRIGTTDQPKSNQFWWPDQLDLSSLRDQDSRSNPLGEDFDYSKAFAELDLAMVSQDIDALLTDSQDWWPADFGHYGPFFIRMTWRIWSVLGSRETVNPNVGSPTAKSCLRRS
jgi:catalase-peroxidase